MSRPVRLHALLAGGLVLVLALVAAGAAVPQALRGKEPPPRVWLGADGRPLPFQDAEAARDFLRNAEVVSSEPIPLGVTRPLKLYLERDGVRAKGAFRHLDRHSTGKKTVGRRVLLHFHDTYEAEVAAYELSLLLGMSSVPPAVPRTVDGVPGSLQLWVEDALMERDRQQRGIEPPDELLFRRQFREMRAFDNLIFNIDRNQGNILYGPDWNIWLIDHTRAFASEPHLMAPERVQGCSHTFWERLRALDEAEVGERLLPYLSKPEVRALMKRRDLLVQALQARIDEVGERFVLFEWNDPDPGITIGDSELELPTGEEEEQEEPPGGGGGL